MTHAAFRCFALSVAALQLGCTFYTGPPNGLGGTANPDGTNVIVDFDGGPEPAGTWKNVTSNLANLASTCGNLSVVSATPDEDMLIAGIVGQGLWASTNSGKSWYALGLGALSAVIANQPTAIVYDPDAEGTFWETGFNGQGGIFKTGDRGKHFTQRGSTPGSDLLSIDFSDPDRKTMVAGGHNQKQTIWLSTDAGATFQNIGIEFPLDADSTSYPFVLDDRTFLMGVVPQAGGVTGIYRTTTAGTSWVQVSAAGGQGAPLISSKGVMYWASPNGRGLLRSKDSGRTWVEVVGSGVLRSLAPIELPDGTIAALSALHVAVSADQGSTWKFASPALPYQPSGLVYSAQQKAFVVWHSTCDGDSLVPSDAVLRYELPAQ